MFDAVFFFLYIWHSSSVLFLGNIDRNIYGLMHCDKKHSWGRSLGMCKNCSSPANRNSREAGEYEIETTHIKKENRSSGSLIKLNDCLSGHSLISSVSWTTLHSTNIYRARLISFQLSLQVKAVIFTLVSSANIQRLSARRTTGVWEVAVNRKWCRADLWLEWRMIWAEVAAEHADVSIRILLYVGH